MARSFAVIVNECAAVAHVNPRQVRFRKTENGAPNFRLAPDSLVVGLARELNDREMDWLELLVSIFAADLACGRGNGDLDWARDIELHVPLRDPDAWQAHVVGLQEVFGDLTSDRLRLHLHPEHNPLPAPRYGEQWDDYDSVALLSGGVDSFVGALGLLDAGRRPLLVSHGSGAITTPQRAVYEALGHRFGSSPFARLTANTVQETFPDREDSQRARSMLFMGTAALLAAVGGVEEVYLNENGVLAVHVPLTEARIGSLSTKTAYPPIVERMANVASKALARPIRIGNKLIADTKPEVVQRALELQGGGHLRKTASCWTWWQERRHCGVCIPCLMRRIAFELHGVRDDKPIADPFDDRAAVERPFARDNLVHLCTVVEEISSLDDLRFELEHPEILDGGPQLSPAAARDLYRRWADQALTILRAHPIPRGMLGG